MINAIAFHKWMLENDTPERAEEWFHYSDEDMYKAFEEQYITPTPCAHDWDIGYNNVSKCTKCGKYSA